MATRRSSGSDPAISRWWREDGYWFDAAAADRSVSFFETYLTHTKGRWKGVRFELMDWQRDEIIRPVFGWKRADGTRRFRYAYIEIPRKNGKSTLSSGIALYLFTGDREPGAEVYSAAGDRDQAAIVFNEARTMVENCKPLSKRLTLYKRSMSIPPLNAVYRVLSADVGTKHGLNAHGVVIDELHVQPNRDLYDVLVTSTGARTQPLVVMITTAGYDRHSICFEQHDYARKVLDGVVDDPSYFAYIACADEEDDWTDPKIWSKANPGLGQTISLDYLEQECKKAQETPAYENTFRRLHLNQWTRQETRWLQMEAWDGCAGEVDVEALRGRTCYAGLDLASTRDIAAYVKVFPMDDGKLAVLPMFFIPEDTIRLRSHRDRVPYDVWSKQGLVVATPGNVIDYQAIMAAIIADGDLYDLREIAYDRWGATKLVQELLDEGVTVIPFGQGFASMSAPTKELEKMVLGHEIVHGANPVLRWMANNVVVRQDPAGLLKPDKSKSTERIDGIVALIMAIDRAIRHDDDGPSVYEERGFIEL